MSLGSIVLLLTAVVVGIVEFMKRLLLVVGAGTTGEEHDKYCIICHVAFLSELLLLQLFVR